MDIITLLFRQNVIMLIYLLVGYLLYKKKLLTAQGSGEMGKVLLYVIMPVAIIRSYIQEFSMEYLYGFLISFAAAAPVGSNVAIFAQQFLITAVPAKD